MAQSPILVTAVPWTHGWELHFGDDHATQVESLDDAGDMVRDYLDVLDPDTDHSDVTIELAMNS